MMIILILVITHLLKNTVGTVKNSPLNLDVKRLRIGVDGGVLSCYNIDRKKERKTQK